MNYKILMLFTLLFLGGCINQKASMEISDDMIQTQNINRILSAADIGDTLRYDFAISSEVVDTMPTFKLTDKVSVTANDVQEYSVFFSENKDYNIDNITPTKFTTYIEFENPKKGFYSLVANDKNIDASISVL